MQPYIASYHLLHIALNNTRGTTCGNAGPSVAVIVCHTWFGKTIYGNKIVVDGTGDQLWWGTSCGVTGLVQSIANPSQTTANPNQAFQVQPIANNQ